MTDTQTGTSSSYRTGPMLAWLWRNYIGKYWRYLALGVLLMVIEGSALGVMSWMVQPLFDHVFVGGNERALLLVGISFAALFAVRGATTVLQRYLMSRVSSSTVAALQNDLLQHLLTLDSSYFQVHPPGALIDRVQADTGAIAGVWQRIIMSVGRDVVTLISLFTVVILIDPLWTLTTFVAAPALIVPTLWVQRYVRRKTAYTREYASQRATRLDEIFHGINPIKLNALEPYQQSRYEVITDKIRRAQLKLALSSAAMPGMVDIVTGLGLFGVLMFAGSEIISGEKSLGQFMSFFTAIGLTFQPIRRLSGVIGIIQVAAASLERIQRVLDAKPTITTRPAAVAAPRDTSIEFRDVHFAYADLPVLNGASFTAAAGKTTALVGASGAGKSTVFNLLTRLVERTSGSITIGGEEVETIALRDLRGLFSVVAQDSLLFDETVRENILLGRTDVDEHTLRRVVEAAQVAPFLDQLPNGLDSPAGPRGSSLSGGQRQRVAIARALLRDAPILLLDEATSALDTKSEVMVQKAVDELSKNRTTLVIAHRLSTIRDADSIVVMDRGRAVDQGRHEELLARGGIYANLYDMQFRSEENERRAQAGL